MRHLRKSLISLMLVMVLVGSTVVSAASISEGLKGSEYELLSQLNTFAGTGELSSQNGDALGASFRMPQGIVVLDDGSIVVADTKNQMIRKISDGKVSTYAGLTFDIDVYGYPVGGWHDDDKETAVFNSPIGMSIDEKGNIYIADTDNNVIRKISSSGKVTTIAGDGIIGSEDGLGSEARFYNPEDVAVAKDGTVYVADTLNHSIRKINVDGQVTTLNAPTDRTVEVVAGSVEPAGDYLDGDLQSAKFNEPSSIAIDSKGNLYVSDTGNHLIRYIDLVNEKVKTIAGLPHNNAELYMEGALYAEGGYVDGNISEALFYFPKGIAMTDEGGVLIADSLNHAIRYLFDGKVITLAGDVSNQYGKADGINGQNQLHNPTDVALHPDGSILIADSYNHLIRQLEFYSLPNDLPQNDLVKVVYGSKVIDFDIQPEIVNGRTMIPVRALSDILGYTVGYEENEQVISLFKEDVQINLQVGSKVMRTIRDEIVNEETLSEEQEIDIAPYIKNGRSYIPIRFFSEQFGLDVQWNQANYTVILRETGE